MKDLESVIQNVREGKKEQFVFIVEAYQQRIFSYSLYMLGHVQEAEDAAQEVFFKAYQNLAQYNPGTNFTAWLYRIAYNHTLNIIRRRKIIQFLPLPKTELVAPEYTQATTIEELGIDAVLYKSLKQLSTLEQNLIILRVIEDKSYQELEDILQVKAATLRKQFERARKKLERKVNTVKGDVENEISC